jgi:hypothetical protein
MIVLTILVICRLRTNLLEICCGFGLHCDIWNGSQRFSRNYTLVRACFRILVNIYVYVDVHINVHVSYRRLRLAWRRREKVVQCLAF